MRVAVAQLPSMREGVPEAMESLLRDVASDDPDLVVFPEGVMHDFHPSVDLAAVAEPIDGRFATAVQELARRHGVAIVAGMWEQLTDDHRPANTLLAVDQAGERLATYRKIHLFDSFGWRESDRVVPGPPGPTTFRLDDMVVGMMTCYDLRFPELGRSLSEAGADVIALPAGWVAGDNKLHHWATLVAARAIENTAYVVASGLCPPGYSGHSRIVDPMGLDIVALGDDAAIAVADLTRDRIEEVRSVIPSLEHRRM